MPQGFNRNTRTQSTAPTLQKINIMILLFRLTRKIPFWFRSPVLHLCFLFLWPGFILLDQAAEAKSESKKKLEMVNELFTSAEVLRIRIEIPEEGIATLRKYQWQLGPQTEREKVNKIVFLLYC
jgi:hypothetical protein